MFLNRKIRNKVTDEERVAAIYRTTDMACRFITMEILMALEKLGMLKHFTQIPTTSTKKLSEDFNLDYNLLQASCEFLTEQNIFQKLKDGIFYLPNYSTMYLTLNFLLAYKTPYESIHKLLTGVETYGNEITRDTSYLRKIGAYAQEAKLIIIERFKKLDARGVLDLGCGGGRLLLETTEQIQKCKCYGIDISEKVVEETSKIITKSKYQNRITILHGDAKTPESLPLRRESIDVIIGMTVFHEFRKKGELVDVLRKYKNQFPHARLFIIEFDIPDWNTLSSEPQTINRKFASYYLFTHYLSKQGLPQTEKWWIKEIDKSGWKVIQTYKTKNRLLVIECK